MAVSDKISSGRRHNGMTFGEYAYAIIYFALIACILGLCFSSLHNWLSKEGIVSSWATTAAIWMGTGLACALYWPLRYRKGMTGHWASAAFPIALLSVSGPFAIIFGIPI